jgi:hypothetical protein
MMLSATKMTEQFRNIFVFLFPFHHESLSMSCWPKQINFSMTFLDTCFRLTTQNFHSLNTLKYISNGKRKTFKWYCFVSCQLFDGTRQLYQSQFPNQKLNVSCFSQLQSTILNPINDWSESLYLFVFFKREKHNSRQFVGFLSTLPRVWLTR